MDLVYTKVYRLFEIGSFFFPRNAQGLNRLDDVFDIMTKLNAILCIMLFFLYQTTLFIYLGVDKQKC